MEGECPKCGRQLNSAGHCAACDVENRTWYTPNKVVEKMIGDIEKKYDAVQNPAHYCEGREIEPKDVMRSYKMNAEIGQALKYLSRAGRKDNELEDLNKALFWIEDELDYIKKYRGVMQSLGPRYISGKDIIKDWDLDPAISGVIKMLLDYSTMCDNKSIDRDREDALASAKKILKKYIKQKE